MWYHPLTYLEEMCQSMILLKMVIMESSSNSLMVIMLKCLRKRGVTGFLPPPGGPMAAIIWMSINFMGVVSLRSYQFQWSSHCLRSSIGGWAPNCSNMGIFKSSTNTIYNQRNTDKIYKFLIIIDLHNIMIWIFKCIDANAKGFELYKPMEMVPEH